MIYAYFLLKKIPDIQREESIFEKQPKTCFPQKRHQIKFQGK